MCQCGKQNWNLETGIEIWLRLALFVLALRNGEKLEGALRQELGVDREPSVRGSQRGAGFREWLRRPSFVLRLARVQKSPKKLASQCLDTAQCQILEQLTSAGHDSTKACRTHRIGNDEKPTPRKIYQCRP